MRVFLTFLFWFPWLLVAGCTSGDSGQPENNSVKDTIVDSQDFGPRVLTSNNVKTGAERTGEYFSKLKGKRIGLIANQSSTVDEKHLLDTLLGAGFNVVKIFTPEHGFRGEAAAGETVKSGTDPETGKSIVSLYGSNKKPKPADLRDIDLLIYDIQDVGVRFYTYISTLHYVMEAAAENNIPVLILDRPNPNGFYAGGPVLEKGFESFVGMHPVPVVHGLTIGEYAQMINGEGWLNKSLQAEIEIVKVDDYHHRDLYQLPVRPSPNLQVMEAIYLYPSLCLFEGTSVSVGRGTDKPFMVIGHPKSDTGSYFFTPRSIPGVSGNPPHEGKKCQGFDLTEEGKLIPASPTPFTLKWLELMYQNVDDKSFFNNFFDKLAGNSWVRQSILAGDGAEVISQRWEPALKEFLTKRKKYLLYPDFDEPYN